MREVYPRTHTHTHARTVPRRGGGRRGVKGWKFRPRPPITHRASSKSRRVNTAKASKHARVFSRKGHLKNSFACAFLLPARVSKWEFALLVFLSFPIVLALAVSGTARNVQRRRNGDTRFSFVLYFFSPSFEFEKRYSLEDWNFDRFDILSSDILSNIPSN